MRSLSVSHKRPLSQKEASQRASRSLESFCQTLGFSNRRRRPRVPATNLGRRLFHLLLLPPNLRLLSFPSFRRSLASDCRHRQIRDAHASERAELRAGAEQFAAIDSKFTPPSPVSLCPIPMYIPCMHKALALARRTLRHQKANNLATPRLFDSSLNPKSQFNVMYPC